MSFAVNWAAYCLAGAAFFVSIKPAPTHFLMLLSVVFVLLGNQTRQQFLFLLKHPVSWASIALFVLLCASQGYSNGTWEQACDYLSKYARLACIPLLASALLSKTEVNRVLFAFLLGVVLTLVLSYLNMLMPDFCQAIGLGSCGPPENPYVFKQHITHGFFVALGSGLFVWFAHQARRDGGFLVVAGLYLLALLAAVNVLLMIDGRTGWLVLLVFPVVVLYRHVGFKGLMLASMFCALVVLVMLLFVPEVQSMLSGARLEYGNWLASGGVSTGRSGMRLTYYGHAVQAIAQQPWFGYGLGGVEGALKLHGVAGGIFALNNPHNQYLLFALQIGLVGLLAYVMYYAMLIQYIAAQSIVALSFFAAFAVANLFNSFHFDMSESVLFAIGVATFLAQANFRDKPKHANYAVGAQNQ